MNTIMLITQQDKNTNDTQAISGNITEFTINADGTLTITVMDTRVLNDTVPEPYKIGHELENINSIL